MASQGYIKLSSNNNSINGVYGEASDYIEYGSDNAFAACEDSLTSAFGNSDNPFGIAQLSLVR